MPRMMELTDLINDSAPVVVPASAVASTIRSWYGGPGVMLTADASMIDEFHEALNEQDDEAARDLAAELAVAFIEVQTTAGY